MNRIIIINFVAFVLFVNCIEKPNATQIQSDNTDAEQYQNNNNSISIEESSNDKNKMQINNIREYILNDLNIKRSYENLADIYKTLNLTGDYILKESTRENMHDSNIIDYIYDFEWEECKFKVLTNVAIKNCLPLLLEVEINDNNYFHLFPYENIDEYSKEKDFGIISTIENDSILYEIRDTDGPYEYCRLIFNGGLLKSILIYFYNG